MMDGETKQKLQVFSILKVSVSIYVSNINFIIVTLLASLPFFLIMVPFETMFQQTLIETPQIIKDLFLEFDTILEGHGLLFLYEFDTIVIGSSSSRSFSKDSLPVLVQLSFLYSVPLHFIDICSAVMTINLASKLRSEKENRMSLKQMFQNSIDISMMKGAIITSLYMLFLSTCFLLAFAWTVTNCYIYFNSLGCYIFFAAVCCVCIVKLLMIYLEWSAIWNMSIVVSVLDGIYGARAFRVSYFFSSGNQKRGFLLMLAFFVLGLCLRLSSVYLGCYEGGNGIFVQIGLLSVVNTLKWVSCVVYFFDCKESKLEKKVDVELGKDLPKSDG